MNGEGETLLLELVNTLNLSSTLIGDSKNNNSCLRATHRQVGAIPGISFRDGDKIVHNNTKKFIDNLDSLPFPDRETLLGLDTYTSEDMGLLMGSGVARITAPIAQHRYGRERYGIVP